MDDHEYWYVISVPPGVKLTEVNKERGTHGFVYCLWECDRNTPLWVGQSIPAIVKSINEKIVVATEKRLHASSLYRCLRHEARKDSHKNWKVVKLTRDSDGVEALNKLLGEFPGAVFVSKSPDLWRLEHLSTAAEPSSSAPEETIGLDDQRIATATGVTLLTKADEDAAQNEALPSEHEDKD